VVDYITSNDLAIAAGEEDDPVESIALEGIERAQHRLNAAGQVAHADSLETVYEKLQKLYGGQYRNDPERVEQAITGIVRAIVDVKLDLEYKLEHGVCSSFSSREFELRESVVSATFSQMSLVENHLHEILRRKALDNALKQKPLSVDSTMRLTLALHRYLNKSDQGYEALRQAVRDADRGEPDLDLLCELARDFFEQLDDTPERKGIRMSIQLLGEISGALAFAGMEREGRVIEKCGNWLEAASKAGSVREDEAFRCFADAFAQIELHLQRSIIDPLDDTSHMISFAEQRAAELENWIEQLSPGADAVVTGDVPVQNLVQDGNIPAEFRDVFIEEAEEIVEELSRLAGVWLLDPVPNQNLRDIRRHFHTFKGNGRAVGANVLGELGWAAQDMLDRVLDGELQCGDNVQQLLEQVVQSLPQLVASYKTPGAMDASVVRDLTNRCFEAARTGGDDLARGMPAAEARSLAASDVQHQPLA
jgi:HPt (histidine-containing phosphotransfer) domain-containing protein